MASVIYSNPRVWGRLRQRILLKDHYRCQLQLQGCLGMATTVDHKLSRADGGGDDFDGVEGELGALL